MGAKGGGGGQKGGAKARGGAKIKGKLKRRGSGAAVISSNSSWACQTHTQLRHKLMALTLEERSSTPFSFSIRSLISLSSTCLALREGRGWS
jgi:hypothetical protein